MNNTDHNNHCCSHTHEHPDGKHPAHTPACACGHHHHHHSANTFNPYLAMGISGCMLLAGIILTHLGTSWISHPTAAFIYFLLAFIPIGYPVIGAAVSAMGEGDFFNEFTLMALASIGAFAIGSYSEAVAIMLFYSIGETLQDVAVARSTANIRELLDVRPKAAHVLRNGKIETVQPQDVRIGEILEIKSGERVPLDGILEMEAAALDTSALTGESVPRSIGKGGQVLAGMIVLGQVIRIRTTRSYEDSELSKILELVHEAQERKAPAEHFIQKFARIYTPVIFLLALIILVLPGLYALVAGVPYVFSHWLYKSLIFLVIGCPCALVISIPLSYFLGIGKAARKGILVKGGNYLYALTQVRSIAFDKTGTLTTGGFEVTQIQSTGYPLQEIMDVLLAVEQKSNHPIARAIVSYALLNHAGNAEISGIREIPGQGIEAMVHGKKVHVGNLYFLRQNGIRYPHDLDRGDCTVVAVSVNNVYAAALMLKEEIRPNAAGCISALRHMGIRDILLLSGDNDRHVCKIAADLGIARAYGDLLPAHKLEKIENLAQSGTGKVAFVGDGMNDAPALSVADIGIAMGGLGSDAAIESADIIIQNDDPDHIVQAIRIGKKTRRIALENIVGALGIKALIVLAGVLGWAGLWTAVFADVGVTLLAVCNALRITRN